MFSFKSPMNIKSKKSKKSPKKSLKKLTKSNLYYHVKVKLKLMPQTELDLTDKEFYEHLSRHIGDFNTEDIVYFPIYNIRLLNKTLYFDILKEEYKQYSYEEDKKKEIKRRIKMNSFADGAWESLDTNFWKIVKGDQELFLIGIDKVDVI